MTGDIPLTAHTGGADGGHARPPLPRGQQPDLASPVLRRHLPLLGLVPRQPQREDPERPLGLHGRLPALCKTTHRLPINFACADTQHRAKIIALIYMSAL